MENTSISKTLFHFTGSSTIHPGLKDMGLSNIVNILENGFKISFCEETAPVKFGFDTYKIPMVCFCDIPIMRTKQHIKKYGSYAIGLKKSWAVRKKIEPVIYLHYNSVIKDYIVQTRNELLFLPYLKIMHSTTNDYKEENEWRYVPQSLQIINIDHEKLLQEIVEKKTISDEIGYVISQNLLRVKEESEKYMKKYPYLRFSENDINYIILKNNKDIPKFIKMLDTKNIINNRDLLISKINTIENIINDY